MDDATKNRLGIINRRLHISNWESILTIMSTLELEFYHRLEQSVEPGFGSSVTHDLIGLATDSGFIRHSFVRPASVINDISVTRYYLFDCYLTQDEWFNVLRFSEEGRTAHILRWGKN